MKKTGICVTSPHEGDDGEAMGKSENMQVGGSLDVQVEGVEHESVMPKDAGWFVAVVRCNCEKRIADAIQADLRFHDVWFEYWVPMQKVYYFDKRTKKRKKKEKVFLSTFIFCHVSRRRLDEIRFRPDVYKMLTMPGQSVIYRIRDKEFEDYRRLVENPEVPVSSHSGPLKKGQRVRITKGQMAGLEAYVQRVSGKKATIGNEIKFISGATIEIDRGLLEVIPDD